MNLNINLHETYVKEAENLFCPVLMKINNLKLTKLQILIEFVKEIIFFIPKTIERKHFFDNFNKQIHLISTNKETYCHSDQQLPLDSYIRKLKQLNSLHAVHLLIKNYYNYNSQNTELTIKKSITETQNVINTHINQVEDKKRIDSQQPKELCLDSLKTDENNNGINTLVEANNTDNSIKILESGEIPTEPLISNSASFWGRVKKWSGIRDLQMGIENIRNGNYDSGLYEIASGSLRMIVLATITASIVSYYTNGMSRLTNSIYNQNDVCQISDMKYICNGNLGIARIDMPQLDGKPKEAFLTSFSSFVNYMQVSANELIPIQKEMNLEKVMGMVNGAKAGNFNPCEGQILVAENDLHKLYVVDGHHRYAACRILNGVQKIIKININPQRVLSILDKFPGVTKAQL